MTKIDDMSTTIRTATQRAVQAGVGTLVTVEEKGSAMLDTLVERGREVERTRSRQLEGAVQELLDRASDLADRVESHVAEGARRALTRAGLPSREQLETLVERVQTLQAEVDRLMVDMEEDEETGKELGAYHVTPHDEGWQVQAEGSERASSVHRTKREAVEAGRGLARRQDRRLVIHRADGTIQG